MNSGVKAAAALTIYCVMEFVHACAFCGWQREADTPVVLPAGCPGCGCAVDSLPRAEAERRAIALAGAAPLRPLELPRAVRLAVVAFALLFVVMAARVGYGVLDVEGAITGVGMAGFLLLPLVPERLGPARR
jgi:hypothetical protein